MCPNPEFTCQKQFTFTPKQNQLEEAGLKTKSQKKLQGI